MVTVLPNVRLLTCHFRMPIRQFSVYCIRGIARRRRGLAIPPGCPSDGLMVNAPPVRAIITYFGELPEEASLCTRRERGREHPGS